MSEYNSSVIENDESGVDCHADLISFLSVLQGCGVELLPITWQPALELLGAGATSRVSQSQVHRQLSFAYKRMKTSGLQDVGSAYQHAISEVRALTMPRVRAHPNVVNLEGVCWETLGMMAVPVLVFPKAEYGNLRTFMESGPGQALPLRGRKSMCTDIANALMALHESGVIHCDIKPQNILVDRNDTGEWIARVSDVGYARVGLSPEEELYVPQSRPWTDPEWHRRTWPVTAVLAMDIYSYGMVCLWLLLEDKILASIGDNCELWGQSFFVENGSPDTQLELLQRGGQLTLVIDQALDCATLESDFEKENLSQFFNSTLHVNRESRERDFRRLIALLSEQGPSVHESEEADIEENLAFEPGHSDFRIAAFHYRLCSSDFRVRSTIYEALISRTDTNARTYCKTCSSRAAFQLAICYSLGLGVAQSDELSRSRLGSSEQTVNEFDTEMEYIKSRALDSTYTNSSYRLLFDQGFINWENLPRRYQEDRVVLIAEPTLRWEISGMEKVLGSIHTAVLQLKAGLTSILKENHKLSEAEELQKEILHNLQTVFGDNHGDSIAAMEALRGIYLKQDRLNMAYDLGKKILTLRCSEQGPHHPLSWVARGYLAETDRRLGRLRNAELEQQMVVGFFELNFGDSHVSTISAKAMLAATLRDQGRTQESLSLQETISTLKKSTFGPHSTEYLSSLGELAMAYDSAGQWYNAEKRFLEALTELQGNHGQDTALTIFWERHLSRGYAKNGDYEMAKKFQLMVIDRLEANKGKNHFDTLTRMLDLAEYYVLKDKSTEALKIVCTVLSRQISELLASVFVPTQISIGESISHMTIEDGKLEEQIPQPLSFKDFNKVENSIALDALAIYNNSAVLLVKLGHAEKSLPFIIEVLDGYTAIYGPDEESTLEISRSMAIILHKMGDTEAAETILQSMLKTQSNKHGAESVNLLPITEALAAMMDDQNRPDASIYLHEEALKMKLKFFGPVHPNTLQCIRSLSLLYLKKNDWQKIESLNYDLFFSDENMGADLDPEIVLLSGSLLHKAYEGQNEWPKSVRVINKMIQIAGEAYGQTSTRVLLFRTRLAIVLVRMQEMEQSISISTDIIEELSMTRGQSNYSVVLDTLSCLAMDYFDHGRPEACDELLVKVIENASETLGAEHRITQVSEGNLEGVRRAVTRNS